MTELWTRTLERWLPARARVVVRGSELPGYPAPRTETFSDDALSGLRSDAQILYVRPQESGRLFAQAMELETELSEGGVLLTVSRSTETAPSGLQDRFERMGFSRVTCESQEGVDVSVFLRSDERAAAQGNLRSLTESDSRTTTYKLALLKAVCECCVTMPGAARFLTDAETARLDDEIHAARLHEIEALRRIGRYSSQLPAPETAVRLPLSPRVALPFGVLLERIAAAYWQIHAASVRIPGREAPAQAQAGRPLKFRSALLDLMRAFHGDWESFRAQWYRGAFRTEEGRRNARLVTTFFRRLSDVMRRMPILYAGSSLRDGRLPFWKVFYVTGRRPKAGAEAFAVPDELLAQEGMLTLPADLWRELSGSAVWLQDSLLLTWASQSASFGRTASDPRVSSFGFAEILAEMLPQEPDRDTLLAARVWQSMARDGTLRCLWSGRRIAEKDLAVDHMLPWSRMHSNALWNLMPACSAVNRRKSDSVPTVECLEERADGILGDWRILEQAHPSVFRREAQTTLSAEPLPQERWQHVLFDRLLETSETLARRTGAARWTGTASVR